MGSIAVTKQGMVVDIWGDYFVFNGLMHFLPLSFVLFQARELAKEKVLLILSMQ